MVILQRYFINQSADENQCFFIENKDDIHHINKVMRQTKDDSIIVTFLDEKVYKCKIISINQQAIEIKPQEQQDINTELPQHITICSGLIKADKYEWMIKKATELGANEFIAVSMERSVVKLNESKVAKKLERWQKIIKEASEQSYRLNIPRVQFKSNLKEIYDMINHYDYVLIAYEKHAKHGELSRFKKILKQLKAQDRVLMIFGPEGGLSENEIALFEEASTLVGLGSRILRAETAPLYALSAVSYEKELLG